MDQLNAEHVAEHQEIEQQQQIQFSQEIPEDAHHVQQEPHHNHHFENSGTVPEQQQEVYDDNKQDGSQKTSNSIQNVRNTVRGGGRTENSLGNLTRRFLELVKESPYGIVDLNIAAQYLNAPKRRVYDITNVLEGVEIVAKKGKNHVHWLGTQDNTILIGREKNPEVSKLAKEIDELKEQEGCLDQYITFMTEKLQWMLDLHPKYAYATYQDMSELPCFRDQTLIAVKAPPRSSLEVPDPDEGMEQGSRRYQLYVKSASGPMDVFLINSIPNKEESTKGGEAHAGSKVKDTSTSSNDMAHEQSGHSSGEKTPRGPKEARETQSSAPSGVSQTKKASQRQPIHEAVIRLSPVHNTTASSQCNNSGPSGEDGTTGPMSSRKRKASSLTPLREEIETWNHLHDYSNSVSELFEVTKENEFFDIGNPANAALLKQLSPLNSTNTPAFWSGKSTTPTESPPIS